jgi:hypothetical protein
MMGDRGQHKKTGFGRVQTLIQPVGALHSVLPLLSATIGSPRPTVGGVPVGQSAK